MELLKSTFHKTSGEKSTVVSSSSNTVMSESSKTQTVARCEGVSKEKWIQYKSQIQGLNKRFEDSLSALTNTAHIERSNLQLVELWQKATEDRRRLEIELENLRENEVYREQLRLVKIELNKLYSDNYELTRTNQELRMVNDELNIKLISLERRMQLLEAQMKEESNTQKRLADELKYELAQAKKTINILLADCQRYSEMTVELEAEIATYKSLLKKLNQKESEMGISCGGVTQSQIVTTTVTEQSTVSEQIIPQMIACDLGSGGGHRGRSSSSSSSDSD